jgi:NAD(P)-dependent dehydrogenase (short-subunit alcohol dehydrogenase family)
VDLQLTDEIIVITGASSGIGRATALTVAAEGGIPILVARSALSCTTGLVGSPSKPHPMRTRRRDTARR